jgi:hypothetical protein
VVFPQTKSIIRDLFGEKELEKVVREKRNKMVLRENESIMRKVVSELIE